MDTFDHIWKLLNPAAEYCTVGRIQACKTLWEGFDLERQRLTYRTIRDKLRRGEQISPVPYFAIQDNSRAQQSTRPPEPTNYNGRSLPKEPCVIALYNGQRGTYTLREAQLFNMIIKTQL